MSTILQQTPFVFLSVLFITPHITTTAFLLFFSFFLLFPPFFPFFFLFFLWFVLCGLEACHRPAIPVVAPCRARRDKRMKTAAKKKMVDSPPAKKAEAAERRGSETTTVGKKSVTTTKVVEPPKKRRRVGDPCAIHNNKDLPFMHETATEEDFVIIEHGDTVFCCVCQTPLLSRKQRVISAHVSSAEHQLNLQTEKQFLLTTTSSSSSSSSSSLSSPPSGSAASLLERKDEKKSIAQKSSKSSASPLPSTPPAAASSSKSSSPSSSTSGNSNTGSKASQAARAVEIKREDQASPSAPILRQKRRTPFDTKGQS